VKNKECKECPWVIESNNNRIIREHSIKHKKKHNCHMMIKGINDTLWDININSICKGIKN
jgi:hypothetical protein